MSGSDWSLRRCSASDPSASYTCKSSPVVPAGALGRSPTPARRTASGNAWSDGPGAPPPPPKRTDTAPTAATTARYGAASCVRKVIVTPTARTASTPRSAFDESVTPRALGTRRYRGHRRALTGCKKRMAPRPARRSGGRAASGAPYAEVGTAAGAARQALGARAAEAAPSAPSAAIRARVVRIASGPASMPRTARPAR